MLKRIRLPFWMPSRFRSSFGNVTWAFDVTVASTVVEEFRRLLSDRGSRAYRHRLGRLIPEGGG